MQRSSFVAARCLRALATVTKRLDSAALARIEPNGFYGLNTKYGWFAIPKQYYASYWTLDGVHKAMDEKFGNTDKSQLSFEDLQAVVDDWVTSTSLSSKPKSTKISKAEKQAKDDYNLFRQQVRVVTEPIVSMADLEDLTQEEREEKMRALQELTEEKKAQRREELKNRRNAQAEDKRRAFKYMVEHNRPPADFNYDSITLTYAWNHFVSKYYNTLDDTTLKDKRKVLSQRWKELSKSEKESYKIEYIEMMKRGEAYDCSEIIPLSEKAKRLL